MLKTFGAFLLDQLFPKQCIGCRSYGFVLCKSCKTTLPNTPTSVEVLGIPVLSLYDYNNHSLVQSLLHQAKYNNRPELYQHFSYQIDDWVKDIDLIIPVPLHKRRMLERGFNQAEVIAQLLSDYSGIPIAHVLHRKRYTKPQAMMDKEERSVNVKDVFESSYAQTDQKILLVDDVVTTGNTLAACKAALNSSKIRAFTIARAE